MIPRLVNPATNPNGYIAAAGAVYAVAAMAYNAANGHGIINPTVIVSALGAVGALFARQYVTPVSDPKDAGGNALVAQFNPATGTGGAVMPPASPSMEAASPELRARIAEAAQGGGPGLRSVNDVRDQEGK